MAGKVNNVGLIEVPMGTTLREVIFGIGGGIKDGKKFKAVQTGGPSGGCLTEKHLDLPIDYDNLLAAGSMMGSGGMIVMDEDDCMVAMAKFYLDFTVEESCGKCAPCRIGNKRLHEILQKITSGNGTEEDLTRLRNLAMVIKDTALCAWDRLLRIRFYLRWIISTMNIWRMSGSIVVRLINAGNLLNISSIRRNVKDVRSVPVFVRCMQLQVDGKFLILSIRKLVSVAVPVWRSVSSERFMSTKFIYNHGNN